VYELNAAHALNEDQPAFEQIQLHSLTRGDTGEKLRQRWQSFLQRFRKLKPKQTLVDHQPVWVPLLDLFVAAAGKAWDHQKAGGDSSVWGRMRRSTGMSQVGGHPMKIKVQLIICAEDGREEQVQEVAVVEKPYQPIEHLGYTLAEAKSILKTLQHHLVA
jgi:hypothetical protein